MNLHLGWKKCSYVKKVALLILCVGITLQATGQTGSPSAQNGRRQKTENEERTRAVKAPGRDIVLGSPEPSDNTSEPVAPEPLKPLPPLPPTTPPDSKNENAPSKDTDVSGCADIVSAAEIVEELKNDTPRKFRSDRALVAPGENIGLGDGPELEEKDRPHIKRTEGGQAVLETSPIIPVSTVQFEYGSATLTECAERQLDEVIEALGDRSISGNRIYIIGNTDDLGPETVNIPLSKARAESVRDYLDRGGIRPDRLAVDFCGSARPRQIPRLSAGAPNAKDDPARVINRRVDFIKAEDARLSPISPRQRIASRDLVTRSLNGRRFLDVDFFGKSETGFETTKMEDFPASNLSWLQIRYSVLESCHVYVVLFDPKERHTTSDWLLWLQSPDNRFDPVDMLRRNGVWALRGYKYTQDFGGGKNQQWLQILPEAIDALALVVATHEPFTSADALKEAIQGAELMKIESGGGQQKKTSADLQKELRRRLGLSEDDIEVAALWLSH